MTDDETPDAREVNETTEAVGEMNLPPLRLPAPSAYSSGELTLVEAVATLETGDGRKFRIDLLSPAFKEHAYDESFPLITHLLVVAPEDDGFILHDVMADVVEFNDPNANAGDDADE